MSKLLLELRENMAGAYVRNVGAQTPASAANSMMPSNDTADTNARHVKGLAIVSMVGSEAFNYVTTNVPKWTGNARMGRAISNVKTGIGLGITAYINPALAAVGAGLQIGAVAIDRANDNRLDRLRTQRDQALAGYSSINDLLGVER